MKLLLIDDNPSNLFMLGKLAQNSGLSDVASFRDPLQALEEARRAQFDMIVVDYMMPGMDGLSLIKEVRALPNYADVPIVMVTTVDQREICYAALEAGATDFLTKPVDMAEAKARLRNLASLRDMHNKLRDRADWLQSEVRKATQEMAVMEEEIIMRLSRASEYRDSDTGAHILRVARISRELAEELGQTSQFCHDIYLATPMHDVGKIGVPDEILRKPGPYTAEERKLMETHTQVGGAILAGSESRLIRLAAEVAETHHERWNGGGYPRGLKETQIPLSGRIVAVADVFDALVSPRPYKNAWPFEKAAQYIADNSGTLFDPDVAQAFALRYFRIIKIVESVPDPVINAA
ncbi:HD domain-containing phosphohydrolase [Oryzibacter oryziterrae]|uniref:HD domain-containing phosphohydrolase n=1 Tax=Oryzibacter oryziterrae TaxID=2766474 RepID=UPI001EFFAFB9|nr:HD domain-containing phosphohydrolase [Oryzibacter oryziterrae]